MKTKIFVLLCVVLSAVLKIGFITEGKITARQSHGHAPTNSSSERNLLPYSGEWIRLRTRQNIMNAGNIEVYRAGRWGIVCDDFWDIKDATVACRQLGFHQGAQSFTKINKFDSSTLRWSSDKDVIMDDVNCDGSEKTLQQCGYSDNIHDCTVGEAAGVVCKTNYGCHEEWISGLDSCYRFFTGAENIETANFQCLSLNSSLVSIESIEENHFLSNIVASIDKTHERNWYTSGRLSNGVWHWQKPIVYSSMHAHVSKNKGKSKRSKRSHQHRKRNSVNGGPTAGQTIRIEKRRIKISRWFPGWQSTDEGKEPVDRKGHTCLALTDNYDKDGNTVNVDYAFWKASHCRSNSGTMAFICEQIRSPPAKECYHENGESYRGYMANTDIGTLCISWEYNAVNQKTHPNKGLGIHNFCRNPDNDARPWCWVNKGMFGFCPVPRCSSEITPLNENSGTQILDTPNCPIDAFFCSTEKKCIPSQFKCDGENDCVNADDETGCHYKLEYFDGFLQQIPNKVLNNISYADIPIETCAKYCLHATLFSCFSFVYHESDRTCQILDGSNDNYRPLKLSVDWNLYVVPRGAENCSEKFECKNGICVERDQRCDGYDHCGDQSDESNCEMTGVLDVRLMDGDENSGRVEVYSQGKWGNICGDEWDIQDANVVCRMLGYPSAVRASGMSEFGSGQGSILLDNVRCLGNESSLLQCLSSPWKSHDCRKFETAGVECSVTKSCKSTEFACFSNTVGKSSIASVQCLSADDVCNGEPTCSDSSDEVDCTMKVELVNGTKKNEGRVEVIRNGLRGTICDDNFDQSEVDTVCRILGYGYGGELNKVDRYGYGSGIIWLDELDCPNNASDLDLCSHDGWTINDCSHYEDVAMTCYTSETTTQISTTASSSGFPHAVNVLLVDGPTDNEGRVEIVIGNLRGTICDDSFDDNDATVICRMLGYHNGGRAVTMAAYGPGSGTILIDELNCLGVELTIAQCKALPLGRHNCRHIEDAGVICNVQESSRSQDKPITTVSPLPSPGEKFINAAGEFACGSRPMEALIRHRRQAYPNISSSRVTEKRRVHKIVGGDLANHGMFPWQAGIQKIYNMYTNGDMLVGHWCGGTVINQFWIVSSAHCFKSLPKSRLLVKVGDHSQKRNDSGEQKFLIEELIIHPNYKRTSHDYDVALLKIKSRDGHGIKFNDFVQPACLPVSERTYRRDTECLISGWGETSHSTYPNILRAAQVPMLRFSLCNYLYKGALTSRMLCAGYIEGGSDTCQGDSGGPLVCKNQGRHVLNGITSWGFGCGKPNAPGVYSRTTEFVSWIMDNVQ